MPIDPVIAKYFNESEDSTPEQLIENVGKRLIPKDQKLWDEETKNSIFGRTINSIGTGIKQNFDEYEISLTGDDLKQPPEAIAKLGLQKMKEKYDGLMKELENKAGLTADEKIREATETITKLQSKNKDFEGLLKKKADEFEQLTNQKNTELKSFKLRSVGKDVTTAIQWNPDKDEFSRKGFLATLNEKYQIDLDENDEPYIVDKSTSQRIKADGSHSTFMTPSEVYQNEAIKAGMAAVNNKAGRPAPVQKTIIPDKTGSPSVNPQQGRKQMANTRFVQK